MSAQLPSPPPKSVLSGLRTSPVPLVASFAGSSASLTSYPDCASSVATEGKERWAGKVVLVTGAASGIGREVAKKAAGIGAKVVLGDVDEDGLKKVAEEIRQAGGEATYRVCDVSSWEDQLALFRHAEATYGKIVTVFANAGTARGVLELEDEDGEPQKPDTRLLEVNINGAVYSSVLARYFLRKNPAKEGKGFVLTGSLASFFGLGTDGLYAPSKHGVLGLARSLASPLAGEGISVTLIAPYYVETSIFPPSWVAAFAEAGVELLRAGDVASAMLHAAMNAESGRGRAVLMDVSGATSIPLEMLQWDGGLSKMPGQGEKATL
ncbi:hypothetical protein JCM10213v2_007407 [Rhodosporidiobolus nylandii]